jgi:predicted Zn-dependent protease
MRRFSLVCVAMVSLGSVAQANMFKPSFKQQLDLGQRAAVDVRKQEKIVDEKDWRVQRMRKVAETLIAKIPAEEFKKKPYKFSFDLIDKKEINAFALPGGPIFFYTGLFDKFKTEDELAAVLGHEMAHVREEHWANGYGKRQERELGIAAILILTRANRTMVDVASISNDLVFNLPYSRNDENRADRGGFNLMIDAGYNPEGMFKLFDILAEASKGGPPEMLRTHPEDKNRKKNTQKWIDEAKSKGRQFPPSRAMVK